MVWCTVWRGFAQSPICPAESPGNTLNKKTRKSRGPKVGLDLMLEAKTEKKVIRDAEIRFIDQKEERLYRILNKVAMSANKYFKYNITGIEKAQIITYKAPSNGYEYHMDIGPDGTAATRKISMSLLLNDDFEGGEICFRNSEYERCTLPEIGEAVIFSSFLPHKVKPITKGERFVVVAWFTGPPFR